MPSLFVNFSVSVSVTSVFWIVLLPGAWLHFCLWWQNPHVFSMLWCPPLQTEQQYSLGFAFHLASPHIKHHAPPFPPALLISHHLSPLFFAFHRNRSSLLPTICSSFSPQLKLQHLYLLLVPSAHHLCPHLLTPVELTGINCCLTAFCFYSGFQHWQSLFFDLIWSILLPLLHCC